MRQHKTFMAPANTLEGVLHGNVQKFVGVLGLGQAYAILAIVDEEAPEPVTTATLFNAAGERVRAAPKPGDESLPAWRFVMLFDGQEIPFGMEYVGLLGTPKGPAFIYAGPSL